MSVTIQPDYLLIVSGSEVQLILKNCNKSCSRCSASLLQIFKNYQSVTMELRKVRPSLLTIKGNACSAYLRNILAELKAFNCKIVVEGCDCIYDSELVDEFRLIVADETIRFSRRPDCFVFPAYGSVLDAKIQKSTCKDIYPDIPIVAEYTDVSDPELARWSNEELTDFLS